LPHEAVSASENQKHEAERTRISLEFKQKRQAIKARIREIDEDAVRAVVKLDSKQNEVRKEKAELDKLAGERATVKGSAMGEMVLVDVAAAKKATK
jgi:hypothetical protein